MSGGGGVLFPWQSQLKIIFDFDVHLAGCVLHCLSNSSQCLVLGVACTTSSRMCVCVCVCVHVCACVCVCVCVCACVCVCERAHSSKTTTYLCLPKSRSNIKLVKEGITYSIIPVTTCRCGEYPG